MVLGLLITFAHGTPLNQNLPFFCKLPQVKILPWEASYTPSKKRDTSKGADFFQIMFQGRLQPEEEVDVLPEGRNGKGSEISL